MEEESDICNIFNKHKSDKDGNGYLQIYHHLFSKSRDENVVVLLINSTKESLDALDEYFSNGKIINTSFNNENRRDLQYKIKELITNIDYNKFDIIIDEVQGDNINNLRYLYKYVKDGGTYIIEGMSDDNKLIKYPTLISCLCNHDSYFFTDTKNKMCIIKKISS